MSGQAPAACTRARTGGRVGTRPASLALVMSGPRRLDFMGSTRPVTAPLEFYRVLSWAAPGGGPSPAVLTGTPTVNPATLSSLSLNPTSVTGGAASIGTVTLNTAAPAGGAMVA